MDHVDHPTHDAGAGTRWKWALAGFLAVAGFFLWTEHQALLLGVLPYLVVLACPLMHLLHHGHRGHGPGPRPPSSDR